MNEIIKPKSNVTIVITGPDREITDEQEVADAFNSFFVKKISPFLGSPVRILRKS